MQAMVRVGFRRLPNQPTVLDRSTTCPKRRSPSSSFRFAKPEWDHHFAAERRSHTRKAPILLGSDTMAGMRICAWIVPARRTFDPHFNEQLNGSAVHAKWKHRAGPSAGGAPMSGSTESREPGADGKRKRRRMVVGSIIHFRDKDAADTRNQRIAPGHQHGERHSKGKPLTLSQLADALLSA